MKQTNFDFTDQLQDFPDTDFEHFGGYDSAEEMHRYHEAERKRLSGQEDNFLGLFENKEKKGKRKLRKAEKQLAKGHTKAAARKLGKAQKLLSGIEKAQQGAIAAEGTRQNIEGNKAILSQMSAQETGSMSTEAGQIGTQAASTTGFAPQLSAPPSTGGSGGGGGDMDTSGYYPEPAPTDTNTASSLSTPENPVELPNVTVANKPKEKFNWLIVVGVVVAIAVIYFLMKKKK